MKGDSDLSVASGNLPLNLLQAGEFAVQAESVNKKKATPYIRFDIAEIGCQSGEGELRIAIEAPVIHRAAGCHSLQTMSGRLPLATKFY